MSSMRDEKQERHPFMKQAFSHHVRGRWQSQWFPVFSKHEKAFIRPLLRHYQSRKYSIP